MDYICIEHHQRKELYKDLSDEHLMKEVTGNNLEGLRILFDRHNKHVFNFLYKMSGDRMLSEDLTQEVFYKILKHRKSYNDGKFISWMFTIARNSLSTHFRRNRENMTLKVAHYENLPEEEEAEKNDMSLLQKALDRLDPDDKELLVLHKLQNISHHEIAEILGSTPGAVKTKTSRALKKLKEIYFKTVKNEV